MRVQDGDLEERPDVTMSSCMCGCATGPCTSTSTFVEKLFFPCFTSLTTPPKRIKIVTACNPRRNGVVKDLLENVPNAEVAKARLVLRRRPKSVAADFAYMARAKRLVVTESTFSFWAAFLGDAHEVLRRPLVCCPHRWAKRLRLPASRPEGVLGPL